MCVCFVAWRWQTCLIVKKERKTPCLGRFFRFLMKICYWKLPGRPCIVKWSYFDWKENFWRSIWWATNFKTLLITFGPIGAYFKNFSPLQTCKFWFIITKTLIKLIKTQWCRYLIQKAMEWSQSFMKKTLHWA